MTTGKGSLFTTVIAARYCQLSWGGERMKFDLLLTDPPYGIGKDGEIGSTGKHGGRKPYEFKKWDCAPPDASTLKLAIASANHHVLWGANYFPSALDGSMGWVVWDKGQRINQSDGELAYTSRNNALRIFTINRAELMKDGAQHPTQKPVELMRRCILLFESIRSVVDPFCGSGSTLVAAKDLRLEACGIEMDEEYCEIAASRLQQEVLPL